MDKQFLNFNLILIINPNHKNNNGSKSYLQKKTELQHHFKQGQKS
jgi:hypothetical protein